MSTSALTLGPYVLIEMVLPGGTLLALLLSVLPALETTQRLLATG
jgi:hypothetical protein